MDGYYTNGIAPFNPAARRREIFTAEIAEREAQKEISAVFAGSAVNYPA